MASEEEVFVRMWGESVLLIIILILGVIVNLPVLFLYFRSKYIRSITDKFLLNLLIADILSMLFLFPLILSSFLSSGESENQSQLLSSQLHNPTHSVVIIDLISTDAEGGRGTSATPTPSSSSSSLCWSCGLSNGLFAGIASISVLAALEIAVERYLAVVKPLHYHKLLTTRNILGASVIGGGISFGVMILSSLEPNFTLFPACSTLEESQRNSSHGSHPHPQSDNDLLLTPDLLWSLYSLLLVLLLFLLPLFLMFFIYIKIWLEARRQKMKIKNQYKPYFLPVPPQHYSSVEETAQPGKKLMGIFLPVMIKFKLMGKLKAARLDRAGRVAVVALIVTILCWSPYYFARALRAVQTVMTIYGKESPSLRISSSAFGAFLGDIPLSIPLFLASLHPLLCPLFYAYRYKRLRTEIIKWISSLFPFSDNSSFEDNFEDNPKNSRATATSTSGANAPSVIRQTIIHEDPNTNSPKGPVSMPVSHITINVFASSPDDNENEEGDNNEANNDGNNGDDRKSIVRVGNIFNYLGVWVGSYSRRWLQHRESVTSTASFITLLSNKYHTNTGSKTQNIANV